MASTSVVLPWSTCAMIAMLRMPELKKDPSRNMVYYHFTMRGMKPPRKTQRRRRSAIGVALLPLTGHHNDSWRIQAPGQSRIDRARHRLVECIHSGDGS